MTVPAANSFLKILEEPPKNTIFILTTNKIRDLLPTIVSRVRTVVFSTVSFEYLVEKLVELYPNSDKEMVKQVALFSLGKTGKAVHLMENPESFSNYFKTYRDVQSFLDHRNVADRFAYVDQLVDDSKQIDVFLNILTNVLRSKLLDESLYSKQKKHINSLLKISDTGILLKQNVNLRLALENLMLAL
jgi:DNA polymerase-3 subunit delta'